MSFDWSEYLNLARNLAGQTTTPPNQEAALRSAISRAYYAAFCMARNHLRDRENVLNIPLDGRAHQDVPNTFLQSRNRVRRSVGTDLKRLRTDRVQADYYDVFGISTNISRKAQEVIQLADKVIRALDRLPPP
jgi:uncharacterized protein (UPF0332 family)